MGPILQFVLLVGRHRQVHRPILKGIAERLDLVIVPVSITQALGFRFLSAIIPL